MLITSPSSSTKLPPFIIMQDQILSPSDPILTSCLRPSGQDHRRLKPLADHTLKCPRCESLNTKFCYYNNYSLTQPRYFCKNCKRYWTKGGALRNVPVGGGCRKNKRSKQRSMDRHQPSQSPSPAEEELRGGLLSGCCNIHGDGPSSSSSSLQQDFSSSRASTEGRDGGFGLSFERLDQSTRGFSVSNAPISINWAPPPFHLQPFDSNILSLNLTSHHLKQEPTNSLQNADDLTPMYDPHLNLIAPTPAPAPAPAPAPSSLNENRLPYNLCLENFGNTDLRWRLPPRLVTLAEEGSNERMLMQSMEDIIAHESFRPAKGKFAFECMGVSGEVDEHGNESSPDWNPPASEGFFEVPADAGYWNNGSWPSDLTMYGQLL